MQQNFGNPAFGGAAQQGYNTLRQFGTPAQEVRQHISESLQQGGQSFQQPSASFGQFGAPQANSAMNSVMRAGATNPQFVQQHIAQDLGYAPYANAHGAAGSAMHAGATNPQEVQQHIAQDLGYSNYANQSQSFQQPQSSFQQPQASFQQGVVDQVMNAAPAQIQGQQGQQFGHYAQAQNYPQAQNYANPQSYSNSTFGQFGTNPQMIRQQIQSDLSNNVGAMSSQQAGAFHGSMSYGQGVTAQNQNFAPQNAQNAQYQNSTFGQFGTSPQAVRQQIQQDLGHYQ